MAVAYRDEEEPPAMFLSITWVHSPVSTVGLTHTRHRSSCFPSCFISYGFPHNCLMLITINLRHIAKRTNMQKSILTSGFHFYCYSNGLYSSYLSLYGIPDWVKSIFINWHKSCSNCKSILESIQRLLHLSDWTENQYIIM
jgi:hypothetical protein